MSLSVRQRHEDGGDPPDGQVGRIRDRAGPAMSGAANGPAKPAGPFPVAEVRRP
ncbi:hypothetical protein ABT063_15865 [Streptomyces sp. NPDC002838]|uniref:hypothetical protein n=1 Tax=Streptomyces sp. NPDC002838 TaxID=3154436 RepID=UPI0033310403